MELQNFATREWYSRLAYDRPALSILDRRGETMRVMHEALDLANFTLPPTAVEVSDEQNRDQFRIGLHQIFSRLSTADDRDSAERRTRTFFETAVGHLEPPDIGSITVKTSDIAPAESFDGLRDRLNQALVNDFSGMSSAMGVACSDATWVQEFADDDMSGRVQFGPMRSEELAEFLQVPERSDDPPSMLFLLVEAKFKAAGTPAARAVERWEEAAKRQRGMASRVGTWLRGSVA